MEVVHGGVEIVVKENTKMRQVKLDVLDVLQLRGPIIMGQQFAKVVLLAVHGGAV
tara:strand:+ start:139 stop:303 length:165 start_codon:yes stop_codon:yes gene_type:complete